MASSSPSIRFVSFIFAAVVSGVVSRCVKKYLVPRRPLALRPVVAWF